ncbi:MAG: hypothetical protein ACTHOH_05890 [Lysobacteraceae bacterium]
MPRAKPPAPPAKPSSATRTVFAPHKPGERSGRNAELTSERIAEDLATFRRAGGRIEVLGTTRTLTRIDGDAPPAVPAPSAPKRRR